MDALLTRKYYPRQALGDFYVREEGKVLYQCKSLELPFKENRQGISCIPEGTYTVILHETEKFGLCYWVLDVPLRSEILIHQANYTHQLRGCIAVGRRLVKMDSDNLWDVNYSKETMYELLTTLPHKFQLTINRATMAQYF